MGSSSGAYAGCLIQSTLVLCQLDPVLSLGYWRELLDDGFMVGNFSIAGIIRCSGYGILCLSLIHI